MIALACPRKVSSTFVSSCCSSSCLPMTIAKVNWSYIITHTYGVVSSWNASCLQAYSTYIWYILNICIPIIYIIIYSYKVSTYDTYVYGAYLTIACNITCSLFNTYVTYIYIFSHINYSPLIYVYRVPYMIHIRMRLVPPIVALHKYGDLYII